MGRVCVQNKISAILFSKSRFQFFGRYNGVNPLNLIVLYIKLAV